MKSKIYFVLFACFTLCVIASIHISTSLAYTGSPKPSIGKTCPPEMLDKSRVLIGLNAPKYNQEKILSRTREAIKYYKPQFDIYGMEVVLVAENDITEKDRENSMISTATFSYAGADKFIPALDEPILVANLSRKMTIWGKFANTQIEQKYYELGNANIERTSERLIPSVLSNFAFKSFCHLIAAQGLAKCTNLNAPSENRFEENFERCNLATPNKGNSLTPRQK